MNSQWLDFLYEQGAQAEDSQITRFSDRETETRWALNDNCVVELGNTGVLSVSGEESADFLQGQFSNDLRQVDLQHSQLSSYCTPKGRMLVSFRLFMREDGYYIRLPLTLLPPTMQRLQMYILRSKVTLADVSDELVCFGASGQKIPGLLQDICSEIPSDVDQVVTSDEISILRIAGTLPRFEIYAPPEKAKNIFLKLVDAGAHPVASTAWSLQDIHAGIATIHPQTSEAFVPQMVNYQAVNGLSFKKGCYPGQEIVARMQYLGKLKRRMYRAHIATDNPVLPGETLYSEAADSNQGAGNVVDAQRSPSGGYDALVVMLIALDKQEVRLGDSNGPLIEIQSLPYSLEQD
jgi:folate-binding protein YgfZ